MCYRCINMCPKQDITTVWMLNRCINAGQNTEEYTNLLKEIAGRTDVDKVIREMAQEFINFQTNR